MALNLRFDSQKSHHAFYSTFPLDLQYTQHFINFSLVEVLIKEKTNWPLEPIIKVMPNASFLS